VHQPAEHVTITFERFQELVNIERTAKDLLIMMGDFGAENMPAAKRFMDINIAEGLPEAMLICALDELTEALSLDQRLSA
jgi:hypothetical protein